MIDKKGIGNYFKKFQKFIQEDSWPSFVVTLLLAFVIIKFIFFPGLSLITGTSLPLVIVESCSMYHHEAGFEDIFSNSIYDNYEISMEDTDNWIFQNGFSKGDVIFVVGAKDIEVGDVIIFNGGAHHPLIHRVVGINENVYTTKGDNNPDVYYFDKNIHNDAIIGKALFKVPFVGWAKLIFFEGGRDAGERGICS